MCVYIYIDLVLQVHKIKKIGGGKKTYGVFSYQFIGAREGESWK